MIRTGHRVIDDLALTQGTTAVNAGIAEHMGSAFRVTKSDESQPEQFGPKGLGRQQLIAGADGIPGEIREQGQVDTGVLEADEQVVEQRRLVLEKK